MKTSIQVIFCMLIVLSLSQAITFGCSLRVAPISQFDTAQYVFIGEVIGVVGPLKSEAKKADGGEAWGLRIKVVDKIFLPQTPASHFDVFPYDLTAWCGLSGWKSEELSKYYPIGSQVRVIAKETTLLESKLPDGNIRLETSIYNRGSIARNSESDLNTSAESLYDYKRYADRRRTSAEEDPLFDSNYYLPHFELRKDLLRLRDASSEDEKVNILERLLFFPHVYDLDYPKIAELNVRNAETVKLLNEKWGAWKQKKVEMYRR